MMSRNVARLVDTPRVGRHESDAAHAGAGETPHRDVGRGPPSSTVDHGAWHGAAARGLLALRWEDVDLEAGRLGPPQPGERRRGADPAGAQDRPQPTAVVLPEAVCVALRAHRTRQKLDRLVAGSRWTDSGHVFATMLGKPHHAATITRGFQDALDRAELPHARFHDLRHSAATFLCAGFDLEDVKNLLGHTTIVLTVEHLRARARAAQQEMARAMDAVLGG